MVTRVGLERKKSNLLLSYYSTPVFTLSFSSPPTWTILNPSIHLHAMKSFAIVASLVAVVPAVLGLTVDTP